MLAWVALPALAAEPEPPPAAVLAPAAAAPAPRPVALRVSLLPGVGLGAAGDAHVDGVAIGLFSRAATFRGADAELGVAWVDGRAEGVQGSLGANVAGDLDGAQLSTGLNVARAGRGVQLAPLNLAGGFEGLQLGLVNVGRDVEGVQIGLVNVARTSEVSIAPLNLIGDGLHRLDVWTSESSLASVGFKLGSKHVYTLVGAGLVGGSGPWLTWGGGFGLHLPVGPLWLEADATAWGVSKGQVVAPGVHAKYRAQIGVDLLDHLAPFVGVSVNTWYGDGSVWPRAIGLPSSHDLDRRAVAWPGFHAGVSLF